MHIIFDAPDIFHIYIYIYNQNPSISHQITNIGWNDDLILILFSFLHVIICYDFKLIFRFFVIFCDFILIIFRRYRLIK